MSSSRRYNSDDEDCTWDVDEVQQEGEEMQEEDLEDAEMQEEETEDAEMREKDDGDVNPIPMDEVPYNRNTVLKESAVENNQELEETTFLMKNLSRARHRDPSVSAIENSKRQIDPSWRLKLDDFFGHQGPRYDKVVDSRTNLHRPAKNKPSITELVGKVRKALPPEHQARIGLFATQQQSRAYHYHILPRRIACTLSASGFEERYMKGKPESPYCTEEEYYSDVRNVNHNYSINYRRSGPNLYEAVSPESYVHLLLDIECKNPHAMDYTEFLKMCWRLEQRVSLDLLELRQSRSHDQVEQVQPTFLMADASDSSKHSMHMVVTNYVFESHSNGPGQYVTSLVTALDMELKSADQHVRAKVLNMFYEEPHKEGQKCVVDGTVYKEGWQLMRLVWSSKFLELDEVSGKWSTPRPLVPLIWIDGKEGIAIAPRQDVDQMISYVSQMMITATPDAIQAARQQNTFVSNAQVAAFVTNQRVRLGYVSVAANPTLRVPRDGDKREARSTSGSSVRVRAPFLKRFSPLFHEACLKLVQDATGGGAKYHRIDDMKLGARTTIMRFTGACWCPYIGRKHRSPGNCVYLRLSDSEWVVLDCFGNSCRDKHRSRYCLPGYIPDEAVAEPPGALCAIAESPESPESPEEGSTTSMSQQPPETLATLPQPPPSPNSAAPQPVPCPFMDMTTVHQRYLDEVKVLRGSTFRCKSEVGTAKTNVIIGAIKQQLEHKPDSTILSISCSVSLAKAMVRIYNERLGFPATTPLDEQTVSGTRKRKSPSPAHPVHHDDKSFVLYQHVDTDTLRRASKKVIQLNSLRKLVGENNRTKPFDLLILDEFELILRLFYKNPTLRNKDWIMELLVKIVVTAGTVVVADADYGRNSEMFLRSCRDAACVANGPLFTIGRLPYCAPSQTPFYGLYNTYRRPDVHEPGTGYSVFERTVILLDTIPQMMSIIANQLLAGLNVAVVGSVSVITMGALYDLVLRKVNAARREQGVPPISGVIHSDGHRACDSMLSDVNRYWSVSLIAATPVVGPGLSFEKLHIDSVFGIPMPGTTNPLLHIQREARFRQTRSQYSYLCIGFTKNKGALPTSQAEIHHGLVKDLAAARKDYCLSYDVHLKPEFQSDGRVDTQHLFVKLVLNLIQDDNKAQNAFRLELLRVIQARGIPITNILPQHDVLAAQLPHAVLITPAEFNTAKKVQAAYLTEQVAEARFLSDDEYANLLSKRAANNSMVLRDTQALRKEELWRAHHHKSPTATDHPPADPLPPPPSSQVVNRDSQNLMLLRLILPKRDVIEEELVRHHLDDHHGISPIMKDTRYLWRQAADQLMKLLGMAEGIMSPNTCNTWSIQKNITYAETHLLPERNSVSELAWTKDLVLRAMGLDIGRRSNSTKKSTEWGVTPKQLISAFKTLVVPAVDVGLVCKQRKGNNTDAAVLSLPASDLRKQLGLFFSWDQENLHSRLVELLDWELSTHEHGAVLLAINTVSSRL